MRWKQHSNGEAKLTWQVITDNTGLPSYHIDKNPVYKQILSAVFAVEDEEEEHEDDKDDKDDENDDSEDENDKEHDKEEVIVEH